MFCSLHYTSYFLKNLELYHYILQVVLEWYDKNVNPVFNVQKYIREFGSKGVQQASVDPISM